MSSSQKSRRVAQSIAAIVGAGQAEGRLSGRQRLCVTWAFGHLVGLAMPETYGFTGFRREHLPILPAKFTLVPRQVREGKEYRDDPGVVRQLNIIKGLFEGCDRIIVATDAGREGELIYPLHLPLFGLHQTVCPPVDKQPDRQGHP